MNSAISQLFQEELYQIPAPVIVIIARPWHKILEEEKALLAKILGSVKLSIESVVIVFKDNVSIESLAVFNPGKVLIFGSAMQREIKPYENVVMAGIPVIKADDFNSLDDVKKKSLWIALKQMFGV